MKTSTLTPELLHKMDAYWRAANYLPAGQIYLYDNPLLREPPTSNGGWYGNSGP
jgi:xylulose-5-phosphate/fructose-6-phosphate phosphoketolase